MLQAALPCLLFAPGPTKVFLPVAQKFGVECSHNLVKRLVLSNSHRKTIKTVSF